jgi:general stress protein 26
MAEIVPPNTFFEDGLYKCPWLCPINIHPEDVEYHKQYHRDQTPSENPDVRGALL